MSPTMRQPKLLSIERQAGVRARFVVYYSRNGKQYLDGVYSATAELAREDFLAMAAALGWRVEVERVEVRGPGPLPPSGIVWHDTSEDES